MNFETAHAKPSEKGPPAPRPVLPAPDRNRLKPAPHEPGKSYWWAWLIVAVVVAAAAAGIYWLYQAHRAAANGSGTGKNANAGRAVPVVAEVAHIGDMPIYLNGLGTVTPLNTDSIHSRVDGEIVKVAYTEGQIVHHDDSFDDRKLADLEHGDQDKSDLLVEIDPRPYQVQLENAQGQLARDQALLNNAKLDLTRYVGLNAKKLATDQQVDTQRALVAQYEGTIIIDQAAIHNVNLQLYYCHIRTPITGRVGLRLVDVGNIIHATDTTPICVVTQLQPITVIFTLPEDNIPQVTLATATGPTTGPATAPTTAPATEPARSLQGNALKVVAMNRDLTRQLAEGKLQAIDNQVDPGSGTIRFRAEFDNKDFSLFPNQFVNARLLVDTLKHVVIVPTAAVQRSPASTFVYVVKADDTVEMRTVTAGPTEGVNTQIVSGLQAGEKVVTDGVDKLVSGSKVKPGPPAPAGKGKGAKGTTQPATSQPGENADRAAGGERPSHHAKPEGTPPSQE